MRRRATGRSRGPRHWVAALGLALALAAGAPPAAQAASSWQLAQPDPPPSPAGVTSLGVPVGLGQIGAISFWAPNRGLLITGGNPPVVPKGLWAYDGASWHLLSTVCGSAEGRIAWAGPDEFWTVSDPAPNSQRAGLIADTLCHFKNGTVVGSYATPAGAVDTYQQMFAAACNGPDDCWFAGGDASPPLVGAFHLHWDGTALTDVLGPEDHTVDGLAAVNGEFFEADGTTPSDAPVPAETAPSLLHRIVPGLDPSLEFPSEPFTSVTCATSPVSFLTLGSDGTDLWAAGGYDGASLVGPGNSYDCPNAPPAMLARFVSGAFEPVPVDPTAFTDGFGNPLTFLGVAPEPGGVDAWVTLGVPDSIDIGQTEPAPYPPAEVAQIAGDGTILQIDAVPAAGSGQSDHGAAAGPITCPTAGDCWMATQQGWLYHLTDGTPQPLDTDPAFASVIGVRPPDAGTLSVPPDNSPLDDSLANQPVIVVAPKVRKPKAKRVALVTHLHVSLHGLTLELSFDLAVRSRVNLGALKGGRRVAATGVHVLRRGHHVLTLPLRRSAWPTKLSFTVVPVKAAGK